MKELNSIGSSEGPSDCSSDKSISGKNSRSMILVRQVGDLVFYCVFWHLH